MHPQADFARKQPSSADAVSPVPTLARTHVDQQAPGARHRKIQVTGTALLAATIASVATLAVTPISAQVGSSTVVTHWVEQTPVLPGHWELGAFGYFYGPNPTTYHHSKVTSWPTWNQDLPTHWPDGDVYLIENYSNYTVSQGLRDAFDAFVADRVEYPPNIGLQVEHINAGCSSSSVVNMLEESNPAKLRIVHNVIFDRQQGDGIMDPGDTPGLEDDSLATLIFPPEWEYQENPTPNRPILFSGHYDTNIWCFGNKSNYNPMFGVPDNYLDQDGRNGHQYDYSVGMFIAEMVGLSREWGTTARPSAIGVLWNGGGGSQTMSEDAAWQFRHIVENVGSLFGGNKDEIVIFGGSRGGTTALGMACNKWGSPTDYTVVAACAASPVAKVGSGIELGSATFPVHWLFWAGYTGWRNSWKSQWNYHDFLTFDTPSHFHGDTAKEVMRQVLTGDSIDPLITVQQADEEYSLASNAFMNALVGHTPKPLVYVSLGTHDAMAPYIHELDLVDRLSGISGLTLHVDYLLRGGHNAAFVPYNVTGKDEQLLGNDRFHAYYALYELITGGEVAFPNRPIEEFWEYSDQHDKLQKMLPQPNQGYRPFTIELPHLAFAGPPEPGMDAEQFPIVMTGVVDSTFIVEFVDLSGTTSFVVQESIRDPSGTAVVWVEPSLAWGTPQDPLAHECKYKVTVVLPNGGGIKELSTTTRPLNQNIAHLVLVNTELQNRGHAFDRDAGHIAGAAASWSGLPNWEQFNFGFIDDYNP